MTQRLLSMVTKTKQNKSRVFEVSLKTYFETTTSAEVCQLIGEIRSTDDSNRRRQLKSQLPFRCPHYFKFKDGHRSQDSILAEEFTWQTCVDIDDERDVQTALSRAYILNNNEGEWQGKLLHAEYSPSGKLHLDIRIPVGMTIEEAQIAYCKALGVAYDESCISPERMIYISDWTSQLYTSDDWYARLSDEEVAQRRKAYQDRGLTIDGRVCAGLCAAGGKECAASSPKLGEARRGLNERMSEAGTSASGMSEAVPSLVQTTPPIGTPPNLGGERDYPQDYMGIPYPYIVEELADQLGGTPEHGNRNSFIFTMACHLRHVCNNDPQWIRSVLPNYGEAQDRVNATIESACRRNQSQITPLKVKNALTLARKRVNLERGTDEASLLRQPMMPERLPAPVRLIVSKAPHGYWPAIANTTFGAFATYTGGVKAEFWNNTAMEMNQLHLLVAPMSIGKSSIKEPINHILQPIIERDKQARQREKEWAEETNTKGANKEKPERPKDICVQVVDSDMTNAAFCQRMEDAERAGNKALFTRMDEFEQLKKLAGGSMSEVTEILRRDFDADVYGQERVGTQSVKTRTTMRHNMVMFARQEFEVLYKAQSGSVTDFKKASGNLLSQWKKRGWIEEDKDQQIFYKTEAYYQKHAA